MKAEALQGARNSRRADAASAGRQGTTRAGGPSALLGLQRSAGNRAVAGLLQRKVGFEAELQVNVFDYRAQPRHAGRFAGGCPPEVVNFLTGGVAYDSEISSKKDLYDIKADRNQIGTEVANLYTAISKLGRVLPGNEPVIAHDYSNWPSIPEYVSVAVDEFADDANARFKEQADAIQEHIGAIFLGQPRDKVGKMPGTATHYTGIPAQELRTWLGQDFDRKDVSGPVARAQAFIAPRVWMHMTAGVIPSALPNLYEQEITRSKLAPSAGPGLVPFQLLVTEIRDGIDALFGDDDFKTKGNRFVDKLSIVDRDAFRGLLTLAYSHVVGEAWNQSGSPALGTNSEKNAVPFVLKMDWKNLRGNAMPKSLAKLPDDLVGIIGDFFTHRRPLARKEEWLKRLQLPKPDKARPSLTATRASPKAAAVETKDTREFFTKILKDDPELVFSLRDFEGDKQPGDVARMSGQNLGIPLERRHVQLFPTGGYLEAGKIGGVVMEFVKDVRTLNTRHLEPGARREFLDALAQQPTSRAGGAEVKKEAKKP